MSSKVRIFQQPRNAMQSGQAGTHEWILEFEPTEARRADPLMGWIGSADTQAQVRLKFDNRDDAVAYADKNALSYSVELPQSRRIRPKAYADNFKNSRPENWTH
jgi:hypothetical protein